MLLDTQTADTETKDGREGFAMGASKESLTITDNRTGKQYEVPVTDGTIRAMDLRQIKTDENDFGLMTYDPAFMNTASCKSTITYIDGDRGVLEYRGYPIEQLAEESNYLEVAYLLLHGELPTAAQLKAFQTRVAVARRLPPVLKDAFAAMPKWTIPLDALRTAVSALGHFDQDVADNSHDANIRKSTRLIGRVSTLITDGWRISHGEQPFPEKPELTQAANLIKQKGAIWKLKGVASVDGNKCAEAEILATIADRQAKADAAPAPAQS